MTARWVGVATAALCAGACVSSEVTPIVPRRPARAPGCAVEIYPSTRPPYPITQIASARASCINNRTGCIDELREQACAWGADAIFGFEEGIHFISATFAARNAGAPAQAPTAISTDGDCNPICSPGFACQAGQCIPQCNPACEAGEVCSRKRVCEPAAAQGK